MKQIEPHMIAAYPITPQTEVVEEFAQYVADGVVKTHFVAVESEHSALSACIGGAAAGGRVMTATASQGLAFMWEMLFIASGLRLPIVMAVANRALSAPINIHGDHSDAMGARDAGWIQVYCKNPQEVYDSIIQSVRISEDDSVRLPAMVCYDGFVVSHSLMDISTLSDNVVKEFVGSYKAKYSLLNVENPITYGPLDLYDYYFEHKRQQAEAVKKAKSVIVEVARLFSEVSGRNYGLLEEYRLTDAELALVVLGSTASTAEVAVDELRAKNKKVGLLRIRVFRPFPKEEVMDALQHVKAIAVLDRSESMSGWGGPVGIEVRASLYELANKPSLINFIYGLGGRDVDVVDLIEVFQLLEATVKRERVYRPLHYLGVRE
jgi:pyruvate ferredoxin oxidoreductase alpha subunit